MPQRILRPWIDSERVNKLTDAGEVFFTRLIMMADDYGRYYGNPALLRSYLFPLKEKTQSEITEAVRECIGAGLVAQYSAGGKVFLQIQNFGQRLRQRKPLFPAPSEGEEEHDGELRASCGRVASELPATCARVAGELLTSGAHEVEVEVEEEVEDTKVESYLNNIDSLKVKTSSARTENDSRRRNAKKIFLTTEETIKYTESQRKI